MKKYPHHPIAEMFPMMGQYRINELAGRIKKFGLQEKGVLLDGMVLDGRNRQDACEKAGVPFDVILWENLPPADQAKGPLEFVFDANYTRRQLTPSQAAMVASDYADRLAAELKESGSIAEGVTGESAPESAPEGTNGEQPKKKSKSKGGKTAAIAAKKAGVSTRSVESAQALKRKSPKKAAAVRAGKITLSKAERDAKKEAEKKEAFDNAVLRIMKVCGNELAKAAKRGTRFKGQKEVIAFAALKDDEMRSAQGLIEENWPVKKAMLYKSKNISPKHAIRDLLDKAASERGKLEIEVEGWKISVRRKAS